MCPSWYKQPKDEPQKLDDLELEEDVDEEEDEEEDLTPEDKEVINRSAQADAFFEALKQQQIEQEEKKLFDPLKKKGKK